MKEIFDEMHSRYDTSSDESLRNATLEVLQQIVPASADDITANGHKAVEKSRTEFER